jgi:hypothetical protein
MHNVIRCALLSAAIATSGCSGGEEAPKVPLGHPEVGAAGQRAVLDPKAKAALDSGNRLYTAKAYAAALEQYRRAAALEPEEEAPLFGILMVATATKDASLADSASKALRARDAAAGDTTGSSLLDVHTRPPQNPHPPGAAKEP